MDHNCQIHATAAALSRKEPLVPTEEEAWWAATIIRTGSVCLIGCYIWFKQFLFLFLFDKYIYKLHGKNYEKAKYARQLR
jgi:hypothetical protein